MKNKNKPIRDILLVIPLILGIVILLYSCRTTPEATPNTAEEIFNKALEKFKDEDYLESSKLFDNIRLQYPASQFADDAQYYVAEINYIKGEYIYAAYNYNRLRTSYPASEYSKISLYKAALCYYELSPPYDRDQDYTVKAIEAFNLFQRYYPSDSLTTQAGNYIVELREKLAHKELFTAELYRKLSSPLSAITYYDGLINDYPDTKYYEDAYFGKIEILTQLKQKDEALGLIELYKKFFPKGKYLGNILSYEETLKK